MQLNYSNIVQEAMSQSADSLDTNILAQKPATAATNTSADQANTGAGFTNH